MFLCKIWNCKMRHYLLLVALFASSSQEVPQTLPCQCADMSVCHHTDRYGRTEDSCAELTVISHKNTVTEVHCNGTLLDCGKLPHLSYAKGRVLSQLTVDNCDVRSLSCVLPALNASGVSTLNYSVSAPLSAEALTGLEMVDSLFLNGRSNATSTVPVDALRSLPNLWILLIEDFGLTSLPPYTFNTAPELRVLDVNSNNIKIIPADAFNGLKKLKNLELYRNRIEDIHVNAFRGLESLEKIYLNENSVSVLRSGLFSGTSLSEVRLAGNKGALTLQAGALAGLQTLQKVILQSESLFLAPSSLSHLPAMLTAVLKDSSIQSLPEDLFCNSTSLVELYLSGNMLRSLPHTLFASLSNLLTLSLSNNLLESVDKTVFEHLHKLTQLYLDGNNIQVLNEKTFTSLRALSTINLSNNQIVSVDEHVFPNALTHLDLSHNKLDWCPLLEEPAPKMSSPLQGLHQLQVLNVSNNHIGDVCGDWIDDRLLLGTLDLSHNNITILKKSDINFVNHNIIVNLQNNPITTIKKLINSSYVQSIQLGGNSFNCDCALYDFLKQSTKSIGEATCESPKHLQGCRLDSLAKGGQCGSKTVLLSDLVCRIEAPNCECLERPAKDRLECDCEKLPKSLPEPNMSYMELRLHSLENYTTVPSFVTTLNFSGISLNSIPDLPAHVKFVDLTYNNLSSVPLEFLERNISMKLANNQFHCDCWNAKEIQNLQTYQNKIEDYINLTCNTQGELIFINVLSVSTLCYQVYVISGAIFAIILAVTTPICYKYNLHIRLWFVKLGCTCFVTDKVCVEDRKKKNDIFLSYVHQDEKFVKDTLLPALDKKYKVCVHTRDWVVGESILDQIYTSVAESRCTVVVLSNAYTQSGTWAQEEFRAAYLQTTKDRYPRCVVILLEDVNLDKAPKHIQLSVKLNTYIRWDDVLFWPRFFEAVPTRLTAKHVRRRWLMEKARRILSGGRSADVVHEEMGLVVPVVESPPQA